MPGKVISRKRPRRRNTKRSGPTTKTLAKKIKHIENDLIELKFLDITTALVNVPLAGTLQLLTGIQLGDTASTRNGNVVWPTSIQMRVAINADPLRLLATRVRSILFWDRQSNGLNPMLVGPSNSNSLLDTTVVLDTTLAPRNYNTISRYTILMDKTIVINPIVASTTTPATGIVTRVIPIQHRITKIHRLNRKVKYDGGGPFVDDIVTNALFIAHFTDAVIGSDPDLEAGYRLYYKDA